MNILRPQIFEKFPLEGKFEYMYKMDQRRFYAIAKITFGPETPDFIIKVCKYFFACDFFKPINDLTFEEYKDYLEIKGGVTILTVLD